MWLVAKIKVKDRLSSWPIASIEALTDYYLGIFFPVPGQWEALRMMVM